MTETAVQSALPRKVNGLAVAGFILSTTFFFSGVGVILSAVSLEQFRGYTGKEVIGRNLAFAGLIIGILMTFLGFVYYAMLFFSIPTWSGDLEEIFLFLLR